MFLVYYITKENIKGWCLADNVELIEKFVKENSIEEYHITANEYKFERMSLQIANLEQKISNIKETLQNVIERY